MSANSKHDLIKKLMADSRGWDKHCRKCTVPGVASVSKCQGGGGSNKVRLVIAYEIKQNQTFTPSPNHFLVPNQ